jgi:hypothetical protein
MSKQGTLRRPSLSCSSVRSRGSSGRRHGREHHHVDRSRLDAGALERLARGRGAEVGGRDLGAREVALLDAAALPDPGVARVDDPGHLVVGELDLRDLAPAAHDHGPLHLSASRVSPGLGPVSG